MESHTTLKAHGFTAKIGYDRWCEDPGACEDTNFAFMGRFENNWHLGHKSWTISDGANCLPWGEGPWESPEAYNDHYPNEAEVGDEAELRSMWESSHIPGYDVFPVRMDDYGSNGTTLRWADPEDAKAYIFVKKPYSSDLERLTHPDHDPVEIANSVFRQWSHYIEGNIHEYSIYDSDGHLIDQDEWELANGDGIYGYLEAEKEAKEAMDWLATKTKTLKVLVTRRCEASTSLVSDIVPVVVPLSVGDNHVPSWMKDNGWSYEDIVQINLYVGKEVA
jgi:hypothetical protein